MCVCVRACVHALYQSHSFLFSQPVVHMEMKFPKDYPMNPPFVRVIRPRFKFLTGHVTIGGSVCMQLLTRSGWRPTTDIEVCTPGNWICPSVCLSVCLYVCLCVHCFVHLVICASLEIVVYIVPALSQSMLIQVRAEIMSDKRAQLDTYPDREYNETEARQAFERMVRRYGWNK